MTTSKDKPAVNASLSSLEVEESRAPYRFALKGNKVISFPDPMEMDFLEAEALVHSLSNPETSLTEALERWLTEEDFTKLKDAGLNMRQIGALMQAVGDYYRDVFGDLGNSEGSANS